MSIYSYRCWNCGNEFYILQKMTDEPVMVCPKCKESTAKRIIGSCGLIFKGSGFYVTDNRSGEYAEKEKAEKEIKHG